FLTILVALLLALILIPAGAFFWITRGNDKPAASPESTTQVSKVSSTEKSSTEESSTEESTSSTASESNQQNQQAADQQAQQQADQQAAAQRQQEQQAAQQQQQQDQQQQNNQQQQNQDNAQSDANAQYGTVQAGEGPRQIAGRYGLSVDEFLRLNGMNMDNFYFNPGQEVRIK
ncbi:MAG: LysM peptidoglycan-binding domain-containing protein, partial [Enterococcus sp.]|nr:LysM peptidoglycan-binding domain-containing protein [Enterococcus sp.]